MESSFTRRSFLQGMAGSALLAACSGSSTGKRPNIVWIVAEDASPHIGCYGERTIATPRLDQLAREGVRFDRAFVTCPVCSPSRSAMITGMYQTTLGAHNHRSQRDNDTGGVNAAYYDSYKSTVPLIPELFRAAGYYVTLGQGPDCTKPGKTDYNFMYPEDLYDGSDWTQCPDGQPFFAQVLLSGGKNRGAKKHGTDPARVQLPPYYPDNDVQREDWADYLNSWVEQDEQTGQILDRLKDAGVMDHTVVFFFSDHGISHARGKQFLYDEGIRIPLIVRSPAGRDAGSVRNDLVLQIDIAAASLALAGIAIPDHMQGKDYFADGYQEREMIFSARDRCDETPEIIRCARTQQYKYIRNFMSYLPHMQRNEYKEGKPIVQNLLQLHAEGKLDALQETLFQVPRPVEELYDLNADPYETWNLATDPAHRPTLEKLRAVLYDWMVDSRDVGLIPEPVLEDMGKAAGNKSHVLRDKPSLVRDLIAVIEAGERKDAATLTAGLQSPETAVRFWAATWLGENGEAASATMLEQHLQDVSAGVRTAAALALCRLGRSKDAIPVLCGLITHENLIVGLYAIRALEMSGIRTPEVKNAAELAVQSPHEFTPRIGKRLLREWGKKR